MLEAFGAEGTKSAESYKEGMKVEVKKQAFDSSLEGGTGHGE